MIPWLYVEARLPGAPAARPPIFMVHGACSSSWVWQAWQEALAELGWASYAPALRGHRGSPDADLSTVGMGDYLDDVLAAARQLPGPPVVMGWSMGGLLALMYAARPDAPCQGLVVLGPSTPAELQEPASAAELAAIPNVFGPGYYGIRDTVAASRRAMPELTEEEGQQVVSLMGQESGAARRERKAGIAVPAQAVRCPLLVVAGARDPQYPVSACRRLADYYRGGLLEVPEAGHMGLVMSGRLVRQTALPVDAWLKAQGLRA